VPFRFFLGMAGVIIGVGIAVLIGFLIFFKAVYAWGFFGAFIVFALLLIGFGWLYDKRQEKQAEDY
jgi:hypothetical protein